jgi:nitrogen fixation protein NifU and related proteins
MFTTAVLDHALNPRNEGPLTGASHFGQYGDPGGGPYVQMWFKLGGDHIIEAAYKTYGCPAAVACASLACQLVPGRTPRWAMSIAAEDLAAILGGLPEGKEYCPAMVVKAIQDAFGDSML